MRNVTELPNLRVYLQRVQLPYEGSTMDNRGEGVIVFLNNPSFNLSFVEHPMFKLNRTYKRYYMDKRIKRRIFNMTHIENGHGVRLENYKKAKTIIPGAKTPFEWDASDRSNALVEMMPYNQMYTKSLLRTKMNLRYRVKEYMDLMYDIVHATQYEQANKKIMLIDLDAWGGVYDKMVGKDSYLTSPWMVFYYTIIRQLDWLKRLGDVDIVLYNRSSVMRFNPLEVEKADRVKFEQALKRMSKYNIPEDFQTAVNRYDASPEYKERDVRYATGNKIQREKVSSEVEEIQDTKDEKVIDGSIGGAEIKTMIDDVIREEKGAKNHRSTKRDQLLREKQKELQKEFLQQNRSTNSKNAQYIDPSTAEIEVNDVSESVDTTNPNVTQIRFDNFDRRHRELVMTKDILSVFTKLNDAEIPVYITSIEFEDSSDELNATETVRIVLEDANRVRHTVRFDIPVFVDDRFLYLNGNKKMINKQLMLKPVVKTGPDEVQVVSNYNKIFIRRYGTKLSKKTEMLRKSVASYNGSGVSVVLGASDAKNIDYLTTIEYDELSKYYAEIKVGQMKLYFDQEKIHELVNAKKITVPEGELCIGFDGTTPIMVDHKTQLIKGNKDSEPMDIVDLIVSRAPKKFQDEFNETKTGKVFMYSEATIMRKRVPIILLLGYLEGLTTVLRKAEIKHHFTDKRPKVSLDEEYIQFADGYLVYEKHPIQNSLLMNGLSKVATKGIAYAQMDEPETYTDFFDILYNQRNIGNAFKNFYDFMIDPVTEEVLTDLSYPTDFVGLILFANELLTDSSYVNENDMGLYRIRSAEKIYALLYQEIARSYGTYRQTAYNNNPKKISIRRDALTNKLLTESTVEDYSTLNPVVELEKSRATSTKGPSGLNLEQAYTLDKRGYDPTMLGIIGISTSPDKNVGIARQLTMEPRITSPRGYLETNADDPSKLTDANLFSPAELLTPLGASRDDSSRTAMAVKQSKHVVPVKSGTPALITNGADQVIQYQLSSDFAITAEHDGKVIKVDEASQTAVIQYDHDKSYKAIDLSNRLMNNSAGGFFLENPLVLKFKEGQRFKKNDLIAYSETYFVDDPEGNNRFKVGSLQKIAVMGSAITYEDATFITEKMSRDMATDVVISRDIVLGKNSNVENLVKIGDHIQVGDELLNFDESFQEETVNSLLSNLGEEMGEDIESLGRRPITSKQSGEVIDIRVYSTVDTEELSPSLQKIVKDYYRKINRRKRTLSSIDKIDSHGDYITKFDYLETEPTSAIKTEDGKIKGNIVGEGVLIQVFIRTEDVMGVGDKLAYFTALKSTVAQVLPEGYEPYTIDDPDEEISSFIAPAAIAARMTPSIVITLLGNKVLVNLKKQLEEIYNS